MIDYTKLRNKLNPESQVGGDPGLQLRVGTVSAVNANGTVSLTMADGTVVPNVSRLGNAVAYVGAVVQVLTYRGSLLVLGPTSSGPAGGMMKTGATTTGPTAATSFSTVVAFGVTFPAIPNVHVNLNGGAGATSGWGARAISISTTGFTIFGFGASSTFTASHQWTAIYAP